MFWAAQGPFNINIHSRYGDPCSSQCALNVDIKDFNHLQETSAHKYSFNCYKANWLSQLLKAAIYYASFIKLKLKKFERTNHMLKGKILKIAV